MPKVNLRLDFQKRVVNLLHVSLIHLTCELSSARTYLFIASTTLEVDLHFRCNMVYFAFPKK